MGAVSDRRLQRFRRQQSLEVQACGRLPEEGRTDPEEESLELALRRAEREPGGAALALVLVVLLTTLSRGRSGVAMPETRRCA